MLPANRSRTCDFPRIGESLKKDRWAGDSFVYCRTGWHFILTGAWVKIFGKPMQITLSKHSDVPLRQQLAEQIAFLIRTGQLLAGQELPSVRVLARQGKGLGGFVLSFLMF
jgi:hypothetical protein